MDLDEILKTAEEATETPKDPIGGIPKQKLPSWIRWPVRFLLIPLLHLEIGTEKIAKSLIRPPFKQIGTCKRRGNCCHYILFPEVKGFIGKLFIFWQTEIYGFYRRENKVHEYAGKKIIVMGCRYLQKDGSCSKYFFRPKVCRTWPVIELFGYPKILKGCGYQAELRKSYEKKYPKLKILNENEEQHESKSPF